MNRVRFLSIPLLAVLMGLAFLLPLSASAATTHTGVVQTSSASNASGNPLNKIPVSGTFPGGTFNGTLHVQQFAAQNGSLVASGKLSGTLTSTSGTVIGTVKNVTVTSIPVALDPPSCSILTLTLGPIHLNLLGLVVDVNQIVVTITAQPGTLLGGLLCQLAGATTLQQIVSLLNQILAAL